MGNFDDRLEDIITNAINSAVSSTIATLLPILVVAITSVYSKQRNIIYIILVFCILYLIIFIVFGYRYRIKRISSGREHLMYKNTQLIMKRNIKRIYSTRVTYWTLDESSANRVSFRNALTEKINSGIEVRRLWHIRNKDDVHRLEYYLEKYSGCDNLSVRCFFEKNIILPELLISYPYAASVSLPQQNSPKKICVAYHFKDKKSIEYWMNYYNVLWETALPILYSGTIQMENLDKIKASYSLKTIE